MTTSRDILPSYKDSFNPLGWYIWSISWLYFSPTTCRFSFNVGPSSPVAIENSCGRTWNRRISAALNAAWELTTSIRFWIPFSKIAECGPSMKSLVVTGISLSSTAILCSSKMDLHHSFTELSSLCVGKFDSGSISTLSVNKHDRYFLLSPIITAWLTTLERQSLISDSMGIGAMFFPPSVMMISLILPVIFKKPSASMLPKSPDLYQKSSENASFVFTSSYNFGK